MRRLLLLALLAACTDDSSSQAGRTQAYGLVSLDNHYIIVLREGANPRDVANGHGLAPTFIYTEVLRGFAATIPEQALEGLMRNPNVRYTVPDAVVQLDSPTVAGTTALWGLDRIDQRALPLDGQFTPAGDGATVTAYIIDTGIRYSHSEFNDELGNPSARRAVFGVDVVGDNQYGVPGNPGDDCNGHGTHVAGTVGGKTYGVARAVKLVSVRVLSCGGSGTISGVIAGMDWVAVNHVGPSVANMSLGGSFDAALNEAAQGLINTGVTLVVAAGNSGLDACTSSPAAAPEAITLGATDKTDTRASWSNWGACLDFFAPGVGIKSAWWMHDLDTMTISGTSMAAPHATGAAALMLQLEPGATPARVRQMLWDRLTPSTVKNAGSNSPAHLLYVLEPGTVPPPPPPLPPGGITITATGYKNAGIWQVVVEGSGVHTTIGYVLRDGAKIGEVTYTSFGLRYVDRLNVKGPLPKHTYMVCDSDMARCSPSMPIVKIR